MSNDKDSTGEKADDNISKIAKQMGSVNSWGQVLKYLAVMGGASGVLFGLGVPPLQALVGGTVAAAGWGCTVAGMFIALLLAVIVNQIASEQKKRDRS